MSLSGEIFNFRIWGEGVPLASIGQKPGMSLNILQCIGQTPTTKNDLAPNAVVLGLRNLALRLFPLKIGLCVWENFMKFQCL